jgi:hypothetical protein
VTRNKIAANVAVFNQLDQHIGRAGLTPPNAGQARWIATSDAEQQNLKSFLFTNVFRISPTRLIGRFDSGVRSVFVLFGFSESFESSNFTIVDVDAGLLTAALCDLAPQPTASALKVSDIVGAADRRIVGYDGHDASAIASLFPRCAALEAEDLGKDESARLFFKLCLDEAVCGESWIGQELGRELNLLFSLDLLEIPYDILSRSLFDFDPASLFLALYRSIEFLYVYTSAIKLKFNLGLKQDWSTIGAALEEDLGWFPREAASLQSLLALANDRDLAELCTAINGSVPMEDSGLAMISGKLIYSLRNSIVHFRPAHRQLNRERVDWAGLCSAMTKVVIYIYSDIFESI